MASFDARVASRSFIILFCAILVRIVDIRIGDLNLLPDTLSYVVFVVALGGLSHIDSRFVQARICATALALVSLVHLVPLTGSLLLDDGPYALNRTVPLVNFAVSGVLNALMAWHIIGGILIVVAQLEQHGIQFFDADRRRCYLLCLVGAYAVAAMAVKIPGVVAVVVLGTSAVAFLVTCLVMVLMLRLAQLLRRTVTPGESPDFGWAWNAVVIGGVCIYLVPASVSVALGFQSEDHKRGLYSGPKSSKFTCSVPPFDTGQLDTMYLGQLQSPKVLFHVLTVEHDLHLASWSGNSGSSSSGDTLTSAHWGGQVQPLDIEGTFETFPEVLVHFEPANDSLRFQEIPYKDERKGSPGSGDRKSLPLGTFDLRQGSLFVVRLNNYREVTSVEQLGHTVDSTDPHTVLAAFQQLLPDRADVQSIELKAD